MVVSSIQVLTSTASLALFPRAEDVTKCEVGAHDRLATNFGNTVHHLAIQSRRGRGERRRCRHNGCSNGGTGERHDGRDELIANVTSY